MWRSNSAWTASPRSGALSCHTRKPCACATSASAGQDLYFQNVPTIGRVGGSENILLKRFLANATFKALYEEKLEQVYAAAFASGAMTDKVEEFAALVRQADAEGSLVNLDNYEQSVANVLDFLNQRMTYLKTTELLGK